MALDPRQIRRAFARAAPGYDQADFIQSAVRDRLLERLQWLRLDPRHVIDLGAGTGKAGVVLQARFPEARVIAVDLVPAMLDTARRRDDGPPHAVICADATRLPFADHSIDMVFSSLMVHWCASPLAVFSEIRRVLRFPGVLSFSTLGPASFGELREAWAQGDDTPHVMPFPEPPALVDALVQAGLAEPVVDTDRLTIRYRELSQLLADLRATGTANASMARRRGLTGRGAWARMRAAYENQRDGEGSLPATLEILCGQAWAPDPDAPRRRGGGEASIPLHQLGRR